jgi:prepilin-type N-terminal cleavage/methylation domain-containing protein
MMSGHARNIHAGRTLRGGFTLIEILSVVIVLGIASAIVIPQISSHGDLDAAAGARAIMSDLLYAQNLAITTQGNPKNQSTNSLPYVFVSFDATHQQYGVYYYDSTANQLTLLTHPVNRENYQITMNGTGENAIANVTLASANFGSGNSTIAFDSTGTPYSFNASTKTATAISGSGTVVVGSGTYSSTVTVEQDSGDISVE